MDRCDVGTLQDGRGTPVIGGCEDESVNEGGGGGATAKRVGLGGNADASTHLPI